MTRQERILKARELFLSGFNCSQSVFCAYAEDYGISMEQALRLSASFGGGIGRTRETCGALCGLAMVVGMETGQTEATDQAAKQANYHTVQQLFSEFSRINGSTKCSELLGLRKSTPVTSVPDARTAEYYKSRPCLRMVETAVGILEDWKHNS